MYRTALKLGCKCVEIDCWNDTDGDPCVYHGHTFTSKIKFRKAIEVINSFAFCKSDFPVILSLEVHCNLAQQDKMAEHLKDVFGDKLVFGPFNDDHLPSPNDLRGKILLKGYKNVIQQRETQNPDEIPLAKASEESLRVSKALNDLIALEIVQYVKGKHGRASQMHNYSESKLAKLVKTDMEQLIKYEQHV